jgi:glycerol-3-phosphate dehydrogenase
VRARTVVNATGVWADRLHPEVTLRPSKGAHLLLPAARLRHPRVAVTVPVPDHPNRYVFAAPQPDGLVLVGLTDDPVPVVTDEPVADEADETFLLGVLSTALEVPLTPQDVIGSFAGLRPLLASADGTAATADLSRATASSSARTGSRRSSAASSRPHGGWPRTWSTSSCAVPGCRPGRASRASSRSWVPPRVGTSPACRCRSGSCSATARRRPSSSAWIAAEPELGRPVAEGTDHLRVELAWAVRHEGARTVGDLLDRRTRIGLVPAVRRAAEPAAVAALAAHLGGRR